MKKPTLLPESGFFRVRMVLGYEGTNFVGWGKQNDSRTVQGEIENALATIYRVNLDTTVAGRTDAGVHATNQVIHVDIPKGDFGFEINDLQYRLNRMLDEDIIIKAIDLAPQGFHARFGAVSRHYVYKIKDGDGLIDPIHRFDVTPWYRTLDLDAMNQAASTLLGTNDFFSYAKFRPNATTFRDLQRFEFERKDGLIIAKISADAFCYNMVRSLIGAMVYIGEGRFPISWAKEVLDKKERQSDSVVFPARGLTFERVDYPTDSELLSRANKVVGLRNFESDEED